MTRASYLDPPSLFSASAPIASPADPETSHDAAAALTKSGRRQRHCQIVFALVQRHRGFTGAELWDIACDSDQRKLKSAHEVYRRLNDLRRAGVVRQGDSRLCSARGRRMVTWEAISHDGHGDGIGHGAGAGNGSGNGSGDDDVTLAATATATATATAAAPATTT